MSTRRPLVLVNGETQELPAGDIVTGAVASGIGQVTRLISADTTLAADDSLVAVDYLEVASGNVVEMTAGALVEVIT